MAIIQTIILLIGVYQGAFLAHRLLSFIWLYFLRRPSLNKYLTGPAPYALITGSTHGAGKSIAQELYRRGFNIIIHSRTEEKTKRVAEEIKAMGMGRDVRYFTVDVSKADLDVPKLLQPFQDLNITLVINYAGGTPIKVTRYFTYITLSYPTILTLFLGLMSVLPKSLWKPLG